MAGFIGSIKRSASSNLVKFLLIVILILCLLQNHRIESKSIYKRFSRGTIRLCSKNLSDALQLLCKDRGGYAEPISNSEESEYGGGSGRSVGNGEVEGPGIVEECCYQACGIDTMTQYCKNSVATPKNAQQQG